MPGGCSAGDRRLLGACLSLVRGLRGGFSAVARQMLAARQARLHADDSDWLARGGVSKILVKNVADVQKSARVPRAYGQTKEKGSKFVTFVLCSQVQTLLLKWLAQTRPADDGPYLFPWAATKKSHLHGDSARFFRRALSALRVAGSQVPPSRLETHTCAHTAGQ